MSYIKALNYYADESNWAVKECDGQDYIVWIGSDDPLEAAETVLGRRKNNSKKGGKKHGAETSKQNDSNRSRSGEAEVDRSPESLGPSDPSDAGQ
jgi:hypothetical protein